MKSSVRTKFFVLAAIAALFSLTGCATGGKTGSENIVTINISSTDLVNPDVNERSSPVEVHVYFLKNENVFLDQDYYSLVEQPEQSLRQDLVLKESVIVAPGQNSQKRIYVDDGYEYVGIVASFRDIEGSLWRGIERRPIRKDGGIGSALLPTSWKKSSRGWDLYLSLNKKEVRISDTIK